MDPPSSPSAAYSATPTMASNLASGVLDSRFFSTKKVSILLDDSNYLLWQQQVLLVVKAYKLQSFLDLNTRPPPSMVIDDDGVLQENVEFTNKTTSRLMFYRALHSQRKGDMSMLKIKSYYDNLVRCGEAISAHEHITAILNGLSFE
ncbi:hypothetical protein Goshw_001855 [Gossypium schwendimanii]|uniref:Retrotransposon Copia-like N-terminal domain-containing protein n=1 Tax=Gossypium schwendimanii TaxID=34291 RepID=A0A7J9MLD3_GOSSC|nr:hypothetical protein [Gossypium schwendimanii]